MASDSNSTCYLLDVNVIIALAVPTHVHHGRAHGWFDTVGAWATTPFTEAAFLRLLGDRHVVGTPVPMARAIRMLERLHAEERHRFVIDGASLATSSIDLARLVSSRDVTDMHLVDLAARNACVLATLDRDIPRMLADEDRRHVVVIPAAGL